MASSMVNTASWGSYSTSMAARASSTASRVSAATTATASPWKRMVPVR